MPNELGARRVGSGRVTPVPLYSHVHRLWLFSLVARYGSFKQAAVHAGLSQSSLSQHMSLLEKALARTLLVRSRTAAGVTFEGMSLLREVKPILDELDAVSARAANHDSSVATVRLGAYESVALTYLPKSIRRLSAFGSRVRLELRTGRSATLHTLVHAHELDVAILDVPGTGLENLPLTGSRLGLYRAAAHPEDERAPNGVIALGTLAYGRIPLPDYFRRFLESSAEWFRGHGSEMRVTVESDSFEALAAIGSVGGTVVVLPEHVAARAHGALVELATGARTEECSGKHMFYLACHRAVDTRLRETLSTCFRDAAT